MYRRRRKRPEGSGPFASPVSAGRSGARLIALVLAALSLWLLVNFVGQVVAGARMDRQIVERQAANAQIEAENKALEQRAAFAESPAFAEQIAREQLGYAREGDTVILPTLPERTQVPAAAAAAPLPAPAHQPNWRGWVRALFPPTTQAPLP